MGRQDDTASIVGINDGGKVQNCGFYGTVSAKQNVSETPKDCTKDNGGVVGKGKAAKCWYFCTDIKSASPLGACGGSAANCYQNVSEDVAKGDYIKDLNSFKAVLQMNAAGSDMWKPGEKHPEFLQESEKLVVLQPLFDDTTAAVQVNGSKEGAVVTGDESVVLTGTDVYYRVGENGNWTKISNEPLVLGANKVATIYYASAEELQSIKWYDPNVNEFVLTTAGQLTYLAQLVNGGTDFAGKTIRLGSDIEISKTWTAPIGTEFKSFKGTFDGEGHVVSVKDGTTFCGLFGYNDGTIRNVIVTGIVDASSVAGPNVGGIAGTSRKTIQNCGFYGKFENIEGKTLCGVANASSGVENCWFCNTGEGSVDVAGNQYNKPKNSYVNKGESAKLGGELVSENFAAVVAEKLNDALADSWFPWVTREGCDYPVMLIEGKLVNVTSYDGADDTIVTIGDSGTTSAAVTDNTVTLKLADSYTGETVYIISDPAEEVVFDGENATPHLTNASRTCVYTLPDGQRFVKLYYGTADKLNADDSWYDTNADKMTIMSAKQLRTFAGMVNAGTDFAGKTIMLGADIVLPGEWTPIGTAEHPFKGTFDGCIEISDNNYKYYAVSGAEVNAAGPNAGLFGVVDGGKVQNLTVAGSVSSEAKDAHVGGIVGWLKAGTVETCVFIGSVEAAGENAVRGGLVGKAETTDSVSDGYCYSAEDVKPVGDGAYTKCFYLAAKSTRGAANDNGARTEQEFSIGRVAWELLGENEQFKNTAPKPHWAQENGMPVIESYVSLYYLYEVELVKRSGSEGLSVIMQANGTNALLDGDTQRVYVAEAEEITIDSGGIDDNYTVTYSPKDPCTGINKYTWGMPNNTFYYKQLLKQKTDGMVERVIANYEYLLTEAREITAREIAGYSSQILALQNANAELTKAEKEKLQEIMTVMVGASGDYYLGRTSSTYSAGAVRAMQYLGMDPANVNGLDYLAVLANTGKLEATSTYDFNSYLRDIESVSAQVWRSRGIDVGTLVDSYAVRILADQTPDGGFDYSYGVNIAQGDTNTSWRDDTIYTAKTITVLAPYRDKEYIAKAIDRAVDYLSSVQLSDGSFPGMTGDSDGGATLTVLKMMEALDISLDDPRFVKNGNTVADAMKTFYIDGVGFLSSFEVEAPLDDLSRLPVYENPVMGNYSTISALTYLQAAENGTFGPDGKGSSVFEVVGAALTETPLGAILLAVIVAGILAFAMVRRYRRIKREQ